MAVMEVGILLGCHSLYCWDFELRFIYILSFLGSSRLLVDIEFMFCIVISTAFWIEKTGEEIAHIISRILFVFSNNI